MTSNTTTSAPSTRRASRARRLGRMTAAGLALAAPLAVAGAALSEGTANAATPATTSTSGPAMTLSTHSLAFGSVNTGAKLAKTVTVKNTGGTVLQPVEVQSGSGEFTVGGSCVNATVPVGGSCNYTVSFVPSAAGAVTGTVQVLSLQGTAAQTVSLSGTGVVQQMQAYNFLYTYTNPPAINGVAAPQSFQGTGFAPAGTYTFGQTIPIYDAAGLNQIGTYRIGTVTDQPLNPAQVNTVTVSSYTWGTTRYIVGTGLSANTGTTGLGSESGSVYGSSFTDQYAAIHPSHW